MSHTWQQPHTSQVFHISCVLQKATLSDGPVLSKFMKSAPSYSYEDKNCLAMYFSECVSVFNDCEKTGG